MLFFSPLVFFVSQWTWVYHGKDPRIKIPHNTWVNIHEVIRRWDVDICAKCNWSISERIQYSEVTSLLWVEVKIWLIRAVVWLQKHTIELLSLYKCSFYAENDSVDTESNGCSLAHVSKLFLIAMDLCYIRQVLKLMIQCGIVYIAFLCSAKPFVMFCHEWNMFKLILIDLCSIRQTSNWW